MASLAPSSKSLTVRLARMKMARVMLLAVLVVSLAVATGIGALLVQHISTDYQVALGF